MKDRSLWVYGEESRGPIEPGSGHLRFDFANDRFSAEGTDLAQLIRLAYDVPVFQVIGGPDWAHDKNVQFRVMAKAEKPVPPDQKRQMLQSLLADRFKLKLTHQPKQTTGYLIQVDRRGPKFKKTEGLGPVGCLPFPTRCTRTSMAGFADYLSLVVFRMPVEDRTSLPGEFDFNMEWTPDASQFNGNGGVGFFAGSPGGPSIFTAIKEQLGLTLEPSMLPVEILVIDYAERPSEN